MDTIIHKDINVLNERVKSLMFPNSIPLTRYFYDHPNYVPIRRAKIMLFGECLHLYDTFKTDKRDNQLEILKQLERGCYNIVLEKCAEKSIPITWSNSDFTTYYHDICYKLASNLDMGSDVSSSYLANLILSGNINPYEAAGLSSREMCPDKYKDILDDIKKRNKVIKAKTSKLYTCGKCKKSETICKEIQDRAGDESSSLLIYCVFCCNKWRLTG